MASSRDFSATSTEVRENIGILFLNRQKRVARFAIVCDRLALRAGMTAGMAEETPRRIVVSGIVGMTAPGHLHVWKNIAQIDRRRNRLGRLLDQSPKALRPVVLPACCRSRHTILGRAG
jgi:hypothetical protein